MREYTVTIPNYTSLNNLLVFTALVEGMLLSFTFLWFDGEWICKFENKTLNVRRSFTLRSNATYFRKDPMCAVRFNELNVFSLYTLSGLSFDIICNKEI